MRALAHIERVSNIRPIQGADFIEQVNVLGWNVIVKKNEFKEGDLCIYIEIDSKVPSNDARFDFLASKKYEIKTQKMRGVLSQGIVFKLSDFPEIKDAKEGMDVTGKLGITKLVTEEERRLAREEQYNLKMAERAALNRFATRHPHLFKSRFGKWCLRHSLTKRFLLGNFGKRVVKRTAFPDWIKKTDEERIQNRPDYCGRPDKFIVTEKIDGTSTTFAVKAINKKGNKFEFIVCSRNVRQLSYEQETFFGELNVYWEMAKKYDVECVLKELAKRGNYRTVVLQGETVGDKLQGNMYGYPEGKREFYGFNLIVDGVRYNPKEASEIMRNYGIKWVPILEEDFLIPDSVEEVLKYAEGNSVLCPNKPCIREGLVFRGKDDTSLSFKAVSNAYLLRHNDDDLVSKN